MGKSIIWFLTTILFVGCTARPTNISGRVECDGQGIGGVVVNDGYHFTQTDSQGCYTLSTADAARTVAISVPAGYVVASNGSIPLLYHPLKGGLTTYNFELMRNTNDDMRHAFVVTADVQLTSMEELELFKPVVEDIRQTVESVEEEHFGIDLGDIVGDSQWLYPAYLKVVDKVGIPFFRAIGNHDMDYYGECHETSYTTFEQQFAPACYSFNKGKAHYIVIDNNFFLGRDYNYIGYYDQTTLNWIRNDLSYVPKGSLLFIAEHIPSRLTVESRPFEFSFGAMADQTVNAESLYRIIENYDTHILSGHMHYNLNIVHNDKLFEHNTGAVCGTWWKGDICLDGTPRGYGVYSVDGNRVEWYFKSVAEPKTYQLRSYGVGACQQYPEAIVANVWNWDPDWVVEWSEDGKIMGQMERFTGYDPEAFALCSDRGKVVYDWISPFETEHLFYAVPRSKSAELAIRATDRFGRVYTSKIE